MNTKKKGAQTASTAASQLLRPAAGFGSAFGAAPNPAQTLIANDDYRFSVSVFDADIGQVFRHGEYLARRHKNAMKAGGSCANVLDTIRRGAVEIRMPLINQFGYAQAGSCGIIPDFRIDIAHDQNRLMLPGKDLLDDLIHTLVKIKPLANDRVLDHFNFPAVIVKNHARVFRLHPQQRRDAAEIV